MVGSKIRVSVLGFGMSATVFHIPFVLANPDLFELVSIFERKATPEKSAARDAHPKVKVVNTLDQVLQDDSIDLVFVSTINDTHYEYTKVRSLPKLASIHYWVCSSTRTGRALGRKARRSRETFDADFG
jgi:predicted dehydrogenase